MTLSKTIPRPGLTLGSYPQKKQSRQSGLEQTVSRFFKQLQQKLKHQRYSKAKVIEQINRHQQRLKTCHESDLSIIIQQLRDALQVQGLQPPLIFKSFAVIREVADRTLGQRHYDVQLFAGWVMINGMLAEMETGEGKTLASTLASCTAALAGIPVHVITANDYLAARDAEMMQPLYQRLELSSGSVIESMEKNPRSQVYDCDIVHSTNKQIAFDYLRDRIEMGTDTEKLSFQFQQIQRNQSFLLRGLCFAIVDEADSILIDEAITPLIITKTIANDGMEATFQSALSIASELQLHHEFKLNNQSREIVLTLQGEEKLALLTKDLPSHWRHKKQRETRIKQALSAEYLYKKNKHYIIKDNKIQIVDEFTGRVMADRSWEQGLHQMIEVKEGCELSDQREPLARLSYQRLFSRYLHLGGTSGTLNEVHSELHKVYGLNVVKIETNRPSKRHFQAEKIYRNKAVKKKKLLQRIQHFYNLQRPVLIGTCSIEESEQVSQWLNEEGFLHQLLNAKQDSQEASIIAQAGQRQMITVATTMAGRGTDIKLNPDIVALGGLHVIALSLNDSQRIDRQLYGRCARQGELGSVEALLSLEDSLLANYYSSAMLKSMAKLCPKETPIHHSIGRILLRLPQRKKEKEQNKVRQILIQQDKHLQRILAFSGKFE